MQVSPEILTRQNSMGENGKDKYANKQVFYLIYSIKQLQLKGFLCNEQETPSDLRVTTDGVLQAFEMHKMTRIFLNL